MLSSCTYLIIGGIGAVGGYIVSPDTVEGLADYDDVSVWDASVDIVSIMGIIEEKSESGGVILAKIGNAKITVTIVSLNETTSKLTVKARKNYIPKMALAQDVFVKIMNRLGE